MPLFVVSAQHHLLETDQSLADQTSCSPLECPTTLSLSAPVLTPGQIRTWFLQTYIFHSNLLLYIELVVSSTETPTGLQAMTLTDQATILQGTTLPGILSPS